MPSSGKSKCDSPAIGAFALVTDNNAATLDEGTDRIYGAETLQFANGTRSLAVTKPTVAFGDANGLVNASEAGATPLTISGLAVGETAIVTLKSSAGSGTVTANFSANGTANANISGLGDGTVTITQVAVTTGTTTNTFIDPAPSSTVTLDKTAPGAPTIGAVTDNVGEPQGTLTSGGSTDDTTLALTGTAAAGSTVTVYDGATAVGTTIAAGDGSWGLTTSALSGSVSLTARATDAAGNQGPASAAFTTTIDQTAPAAPTIGTVTDNAGSATGALTSGGTTDDTTLALAGTAEAGSIVRSSTAARFSAAPPPTAAAPGPSPPARCPARSH